MIKYRYNLYRMNSLRLPMPRKAYKGKYGTVYFNSEEELDRWEEKAREHHITFSTLAKEALNQLAEKKEARPDLIQKCSELEDQVTQLQTELRLKTTLLTRLENDIFKLKHSPFADIDQQDGARTFSLGLIGLLKDGRVHDSEEILSLLGIDKKDFEACRLVQNQLAALANHRLVTETSRGWRWL